MSIFDPTQPLWLPTGSVRALLAIVLTAAFIAGLVDRDVLLLVVGFYFAHRTKTEPRPPHHD